MIDASSHGLRRTLGPSTWLVFEELLLFSTGDGELVLAQVSVRSLAASLGLAKDTVARAIGRLRAAGLVTAVQQRAVSGVFATGTYRMTTPDSIRLVAGPHQSRPSEFIHPVAAPRASHGAVASRPASGAAQLALVFEA